MKSILVAVLLIAPLLCAQSTSTNNGSGQSMPQLPAACGAASVQFNVKKDDMQHVLPRLEQNKAQIIFIHDAGDWGNGGNVPGYPTTRLAIDGTWVGANHDNTWFAVSAEPGEHHLCVALQSRVVRKRVELAHLTAQPGAVYYFRTRLVWSKEVELLELEPVDSDEGDYLLRMFSMSVSKPKK